MGFFSWFKRDKISPELLRDYIRSGFDDSVKQKEQAALEIGPMAGLMIQAVLVDYYQNVKSDYKLRKIAEQSGIDFDAILEDEKIRAINKYLVY